MKFKKTFQKRQKTYNYFDAGGRVDARIPLKEYQNLRVRSVYNINCDRMTLGKFISPESSDNYINKAKSTGDMYFNMGKDWDRIKKMYGITDDDMFKLFNEPVLDDAVKLGKTIRFSQNPEDYPKKDAIYQEYDYLKNKYHYELISKKDGYWYIRK